MALPQRAQNWSPLSSGVQPQQRRTVEEYDGAIERAKADGNNEAAERLAERRRVEKWLSDYSKAMEAGPESDEYKLFFPIEGMSGPERFMGGMGLAGRNLGRGAAELVGVDVAEKDPVRAARDQALMQTPGGISGNIAGNVGMALPTAFIPGANTVAGATAIGATLGALQPTGERGLGSERLQNTAMGGAGGLVGGAIARGLSRGLNPRGNPAAQQYLDDGINLTPGQRMGGLANRVEERAMSIPFIGDDIARARTATRDQFNVSTINRILAPIRKKVTKSGREGILEAFSVIDDRYDQILGSIKSVQIDDAFGAQMRQLDEMAQTLPPDRLRQVNNIIQRKVANNITESGRMSGESFKKVQSEMRRLGRDYLKSQDPDQRQVGALVSQLGRNLTDMLGRQNRTAATALRQVDDAYAGFLRVERAAASTGAREGVFTPAQLNQSVRAMDRPRAFAQGDALLQDWSDDAMNVIGNNVPNSGTADRLMNAGALVGGGAGLMANPLGTIGGGLAAKGASSAMYSPGGVRAMGALLGGRPDMLRQMGQTAGQLAGPAGALGGYYLSR